MLILVNAMLALDAEKIYQIELIDGVINISLDNNIKWSLYNKSKQSFSKLVKQVNEAQAKIAEKGSTCPQG